MKLKKVMTGCLATVMMVTASVFPAFADTTAISTSGSGTTTVTYVQESTFTVQIPKSVVLTKTTENSKTVYKNSYTVSLSSNANDLVKTDSVTVTPTATVTMIDSHGKANVTANVTQAKTSFTYESHDNLTGTVQTDGLTAGNWTGSLQFAIKLNTK